MKMRDIMNLLESASDLTQTPQFKAWFGNSVVVDQQGKPLRVYHGTGRDFDTFELPEIGGHGNYGKGFYFTTNPGSASEYADEHLLTYDPEYRDGPPPTPNVLPVYLRIQKPYIYQVTGGEYIIQNIVKLGFDGLVIQHPRWVGHRYTGYDPEHPAMFVVRDPKQIKSATGNRGTYNPDDPRITEDVSKSVTMTLYHGTRSDFDKFDPDKLPESGAYGSGFYFSSSYSLGRQYSGGNEPMICRVTLHNPFVIDEDAPYEERPRLRPASTLRQRLTAQGYDGILVKQDSDNGYREMIAYNPDNITILGRGKIER